MAKAKRILTKSEYDALPAERKELYTKSDTGDDYILDTDDQDYKQRIDEFRSKNVELLKAAEEHKKTMEKYKGIDPVQYEAAKTALEKINQMEEAELIKAGKMDEVFAKRVERMKKEHEDQLNQLRKSNEALTNDKNTLADRLGSVLIDTSLTTIVGKIAKIRPGAEDDVRSRGRRVWRLNEKGEMVPVKPDGTTFYGPRGEPITMEEYATDLIKSAPHLFEAAGGGGAGGGKQGDGGGSGDGKTIDKNDANAFSRNLEKIAKGEVKVA